VINIKIGERVLRRKITNSLLSQGFKINPHLKPSKNGKQVLKRIHNHKRIEQIKLHKDFIIDNLDDVKAFSIDSSEINPKKIDLKLIQVKPNTFESKMFFWWNLMWWSLPYDRPIGRQMKFILWDDYHNAPFGLVGLQSPPLRSGVRDKFLGLDRDNVDYWINQSMYAQRVGALPPYNEILGGKMVAMSLVSNEIRNSYKRKYHNNNTILRKRKLPSRLLFITTTSAYGKSSVYERLKYNGETIGKFIGFTSGAGTFHISESLYNEMLIFLKQSGMDVSRGYGTGPSRKLELIDNALQKLKIPKFTYHNIKRGYYVFDNTKNLSSVITDGKRPRWHDRSLNDLFDYWLNRWCLPRIERNSIGKFNSDNFFRSANNNIKSL
jgi:hypothetical protein